MILIVDMNWKKDSIGQYEFVLPIVSIASEFEEYRVKHYREVNSNDITNCSKIILSGTTLKDNATLDQIKKFDWLHKVNKPILGICSGMQTIGVIFGSHLIKCSEIGMTEITTVKKNPLFSSSFKVYSLHNYSLELSNDFEELAKSSRCIQAMKHIQKPIYGLLFHPEVRNVDIVKRFFELEN